MTVYPVIETTFVHPITKEEHWIPSCCFHDLFSSPAEELSGMGLAIIGNVIKLVQDEMIPDGAKMHLRLRMSRNSETVRMPWPGMPTDNPDITLNIDELPFDTAMFQGDDNHFKKRIDRLKLMDRIEGLWTVWLIEYLTARV